MRVVSLSECDAEWEAFADQSDETWVFHRRKWLDIESGYFAADNHSFAISDGVSLVAIAPLYFCSDPALTGGERLLHSGMHRHAGPAFSRALSGGARRSARAAVMQQIFRVAAKTACDRIMLSSHNLAARNLTQDREEIPYWVTEHGFFLGHAFTTYGMVSAPGLTTCVADQIVPLGVSEDEMFGNLSDPCRRAVRKAKKNGLTHAVLRDGDGVDRYYELAQASARRTGEALPPKAYYKAIVDAFGASAHCAIHFALLNDKPVAAVFLLIDKAGASFLAGVSDPDFLTLRVNDFVHWSAIVWCKEQGCLSYRFGPVFPEVPSDWPIARVSAFKKKFGSRSHTIIQASCYRNVERYRASALAHLERLWSNISMPVDDDSTSN